jgi:hypothetical protein
MKNKKTLSLLSLLIIPGILLFPVLFHSIYIILPILMCIVGGYSFGCLLRSNL